MAVLLLLGSPEALIQHQTGPRGIYGGQSGNETGFHPHTLVFPYRYHSTNASGSYTHLPLTL